jgi:hypothetical protein
MISASLPGVFLFVQRGALRLIRTVVNFVAMLMSNVCLALLRAMITCVVFATCTLLMMYYLGLPVPGPAELFDKLEDLGRLARILS